MLIGINKYPYLPERNQLKGCHNDVSAFKSVLEGKFGFASENIQVLQDEEASRDGIIGAMKTLLANCSPNDCITFFFSGHGSRLKARRKDKPSGWYESIMPFDSGRKKLHPEAVNRDITDDEIYEWLMALAEKTSNIVLIFDSCYSGSITREDIFESGIRRKGVLPEDTVIHEKPAPLFFHSRPFTEENSGKGQSGWLPASDKYILFAASAETERAHLYTEVSDNGTVEYGLFSYFLCQALREAQSGATYRDIFERVYIDVKTRFEDQSVQLEGERDRKLFDLEEFPPKPFLMVSDRKIKFLTLSGGAVHGVTVGSRWMIFPSGTKQFDAKPSALGQVKIVSVQSVTSKAKVLRELSPGSIQAGCRAAAAVESSQPKAAAEGIKIKVRNGFPQFRSIFKELIKNIRQSVFLELTENDDLADVTIYLGENSSRQVKGVLSPPMRMMQLARPSLMVSDRRGSLLMPPQSVNDPESIGIIAHDLERLGRYRRVLELRNPQSVLSGKIDFIILRQNQDLSWSEVEPEGKASQIVIYESERIALRIINRFEFPIFFTILDFGLCKDISVVYPPKGAKDIIGPLKPPNPGKLSSPAEGKGVLTIGTGDDQYIKLFFPSGFPFDALLPAGGGRSRLKEGLEIFKLIVTTRPHDLSFLEQPSFQTTRDSQNQLESLIFGALERSAENFDKDPLSELENEWLTVEKPFLLKRK